MSGSAPAVPHPVPLLRTIRPAVPDDLGALTELWIEVTRHHEPLDPLFRLRHGAGSEIRALLRGFLRDPDSAVFVGEVEGRVVGMSCVRIHRAPPILQETQRAEITDLVVQRGLRRRGIGRALAEAALDWIGQRGVERVEVRVVASNPEGQGFWRHLGFGDHVDVLQRRL